MTSFDLQEAVDVLERTPDVLESLLSGLSDEWIYSNEGGESWTPYDIVGHLIHGETTDWIVRAELILEDEARTFEPFDRFAQFEESGEKTLAQLLEEFRDLRTQSLKTLEQRNLTEDDLEKTGIHPDLGEVTLRELLATWTAHDLSHIRQIARVMARQYAEDVGPWRAYLPVMDE